ncbi:hypothetical protein K440DRAFT_687553 [Wilcoxina mikolae CBS 423.85]|nr:hypothetical protein K440DRAFT_687553 [Wilcoxina mikolae CBS 423.85]
MHLTNLLAPLLLLLPLTTATAIPNAVAQPISKPKPSPPSILFAPPATSNTFANYAYEKCKDLGIDPHGKHPDDYTHEDKNGRHFLEGSNYYFWAVAQGSDKMDDGNGKRDAKSINVIMWSDNYCSKNGYHVYDLDKHVGQKFFDAQKDPKTKKYVDRYSLSITAGNVDPNYWRIHLKSWTGPGTTDCTETFMYVGGGKNCYPHTRKFSCVQLMYEEKAKGKPGKGM